MRGKAVEIDTIKTLHYIQAVFYFFWDIRFFGFFFFFTLMIVCISKLEKVVNCKRLANYEF